MTFPVLNHEEYPNVPSTIPLELIQPHETQAKNNHGGQDLKRLAERGGLTPSEIVPIILDYKFNPFWKGCFPAGISREQLKFESAKLLLRYLEQFKSGQPIKL